MEDVNCALCGADDFKILLRRGYDPILKKPRGRFVVCKRCGLIYQNPKLEEKNLEEIYRHEFRSIEPPDYYLQASSNEAMEKVNWIEGFLDSKGEATRKVLDIGCSAGTLLQEFKRRKWQTFGVEPNLIFAHYAKNNGIEVEVGFFNKKTFDNQKFDLITTSHVLEHIPDPIGFLELAKRKLKREGYIFVEIPDIYRPDVFGGAHFYVFSKNTLIRCLLNAGFKVVEFDKVPRGIRMLASGDGTQKEVPVDDYREVYQKVKEVCAKSPSKKEKRKIRDLGEAIAPIYQKRLQGKDLTKGEIVLLLIEKILTQNWGSQGGFRKIRYQPTVIEGEVKKVLVIQVSSIGDVVYTTPALKGLRERFPHASITMLVAETPAGIISGNPDINEIAVFPRERYLRDLSSGKRSFYAVVSEIYGNLKLLTGCCFDLVVNLSVTPLSGFISHLIGSRNLFGLTVDEKGNPLLRGGVWVPYTFYIKANRPMQDLNRLDLMELHLRMADVNPSKRKLEIYIDQKTQSKAESYFEREGVGKNDLLIGLNPGAGFRSRCWEKERFAALGDRLIKEYGARIIIFGGPKEEGLAKEIVELMESEGVVNLAAKTSLKELTACLDRCNHLITNDTGPMHIAAAMHTPIIGICGPTRVGPLGKERHLLLQADLDCIGCGTTSVCTKGDCMAAIPVEAVMAALRYQRGELKEPPVFEGISIYAAGCEEPGRLFFYQSLNKNQRDKKWVGDEILKLLYLNLWMRENNRLGFYPEKEISPEEMQAELIKRVGLEEIASGLEKKIEGLKEYRAMCDEAVRYLRNSRRDEESLVKYKMVADRLYEEIGRLFSFYDLLYPDSSSEDYLARCLKLCQLKREASIYMVDFLEKWREAL